MDPSSISKIKLFVRLVNGLKTPSNMLWWSQIRFWLNSSLSKQVWGGITNIQSFWCLLCCDHTHIPTSGLFIIRRTNRSHTSSILEMPSLCSDHTLAKHLTIKAFLFQGHINSFLFEQLNLILLNIKSKSVIQQIDHLQSWSRYFGTLQCLSTDPINK